MAIRVGIDVACRASHRAACADASGQLLWRNVRFQTNAEDLEELWRRLPEGEKDIMVVIDTAPAMPGCPWPLGSGAMAPK